MSKAIIIILVLSLTINFILGFKLRKLTNEYEKCLSNTSTVYEYLDSITEKSFKERVSNGERVVVYIGRPDCNDCIYFEPVLRYLVEKTNISVEIKYLNAKIIRENGEEYWNNFKQMYQFTQTPAILLYDNGVYVDAIEWSEDGLTYERLLTWLQKNNVL